MITDFKNLFSGLTKRIINLVQEFVAVDSRRLLLLLKDVKRKIRDIKGTNVKLMFFHLHHKNMGDAFFRLILISVFCKRDALINLGFIQYYIHKGNFVKAKQYLDDVNKSSKCSALQNSELNFDMSQKIEWYDSVITEQANLGCLSVIIDHFTILSSDYVEDQIIKSDYRAHILILKSFMKHFSSDGLKINVLDIGCGTGINCHFLRMNGIANLVEGIDISSNMCSIASKCQVDERKVYDYVHVADYRDVLVLSEDESPLKSDKYEAVIAVDSLNYDGIGIVQHLKIVRNKLKSGGLFVFAVPCCEDSKDGFILKDSISSCFAYTTDYISDALKSADFQVIRKNYIDLYKNRKFHFFECTLSDK
ncbi:methyltransferase domain-containing protein [Anaplasmataceae bacterium AB001_6]|nr:methyltransferase domain-containing protein [Anaplasmataceae bacterium AB001_6]